MCGGGSCVLFLCTHTSARSCSYPFTYSSLPVVQVITRIWFATCKWHARRSEKLRSRLSSSSPLPRQTVWLIWKSSSQHQTTPRLHRCAYVCMALYPDCMGIICKCMFATFVCFSHHCTMYVCMYVCMCI